MYRNFGINYKYPRSTGGKFFQQKIDEGRSGLMMIYGVFPTSSIPSDTLWQWNETNASQFGTGFWITGANSTLGTGTVSVSTLTSSFATFMPGVKFELQKTAFSASGNSATYLMPILDMPDLPRRYTFRFTFDNKALGGSENWTAGFCFGTTTSSNISDFYGNVVLFESGSGNKGFPLKTIQSGTASALANAPSLGPILIQGGAATQPVLYTINVEMSSTFASSSGPNWRGEMNFVREHDDTSDNFGSILDINAISGNYGNWNGTAEMNKFYLVFHATTASTNSRWIGLTSLGIYKHPLDRVRGTIEV